MRKFVRDNPGSFDISIDRISRILSENGIRYALAGALAQAHYVEDPRSTKDVDIAIATDIPLETIYLMLSNYGYKQKNIYDSDTALIRSLVMIDPDGMPVDLLSIPGFMFNDLEYPLGSRIPVINRNAIAAMKYLASKSVHVTEFKRDRYSSDYKELLTTGGASKAGMDLYVALFKK